MRSSPTTSPVKKLEIFKAIGMLKENVQGESVFNFDEVSIPDDVISDYDMEPFSG